ncbi:unnamed protein product, partial [Symbiodinium sp. CCMP2592]
LPPINWGRLGWPESLNEGDIVIALLGHDPSIETATRDKIKSWCKGDMKWLTPVRTLIQSSGKTCYVEFILIGHMPNVNPEALELLQSTTNFQTMDAYPHVDLRRPVPWAASVDDKFKSLLHFLMPQQAWKHNWQVCACAGDEEMKACPHLTFVVNRTISLRSNSEMKPDCATETNEADSADVELESLAENEKKTNPHVFGQSEIFFQKLFEHLTPTCVILPATAPVPGLCMGLLLYNQTRLASGAECAILALPLDLAPPKRARLHNAATSLSRVRSHWVETRVGDMLAARKKAGASTEDKKKKERQLQRVESAPDEHIDRFVVHKYVIPPQDLGPPHGESDSDGDEGDVSSCVTPEVVSRRMHSAMTKTGVAIKTSPGSEVAGLGMIAEVALKKGYEIPVRGPVYKDLENALSFTTRNPTYQDKILKFYVGAEGDHGGPLAHYIVQTGLSGFCNHFAGLSRQGNVKLVAYPKRGLGDKLFVLQVTRTITPGTEIVMNYNTVPWFPLAELPKTIPKPKARKSKGKAKKAEAEESMSEEDDFAGAGKKQAPAESSDPPPVQEDAPGHLQQEDPAALQDARDHLQPEKPQMDDTASQPPSPPDASPFQALKEMLGRPKKKTRSESMKAAPAKPKRKAKASNKRKREEVEISDSETENAEAAEKPESPTSVVSSDDGSKEADHEDK